MSDAFSSALAPLQLPDPEDRVHHLGAFWESAPAVVVFLRHYG